MNTPLGNHAGRQRPTLWLVATLAAVTLGCAVSDSGAAARARGRSRWPVATADAAAPATGCTTAPTAFVPCDTAIPGFRGRSVSIRSALAGVPRGLTAELRRASGHAVDFRPPARAFKGGAELTIAAWRLRSVFASVGALSRWRAAERRRHPSGLGKLGFSVSRHERQPAIAVLDVNGVIVELSLKTSMPAAAGQRLLAGAASLEAHQLQSAGALTGFDRLSDAITAHRGPTPQQALEAFALIGGTGPGVPHPMPGGGVIDGTEALGWVFQELPRFSAAQRRAVHRFLARTFPAPHKPSESVAHGSAFAEHVDHAITAVDYQAIADQMLTRIEAQTGALDIAPVVSKDPYPNVHDGETTYALTDFSSEYPCDITVFESTDHLALWQQQHVLAHELAHCMQRKYLGYWSLWWKVQVPWIKEGVPEWVADQVAPIPGGADPNTYPEVFLYRWDRQPGVSLEQLYSGDEGVGFLGHVADQVGVGTVWSRMPALMSQKDTAGALAALVGSSATEVYDSWGGSYALRDDLGINWERIDPWRDPSTESFPGAGVPAVVPSGSLGLPVRPDRGSLFDLSTTQPLLRVSTSGTVFGRIADADGHDIALSQTAGQLYCTADDPSMCDQCPTGTQGTIPASEPLTGDLLVSLSAGASPTAGAADFTGIPLTTYCTPTTAVIPSGPPGADGGSGGDPHMIDFGGGLFDFQQAGEFTLVKSTNRNLDIQVRQQPLSNCCVTFNTAAAMRVGHATVEVDRKGASGISVYVDKRAIHGSSAKLAGGGHLSIGPGSLGMTAAVTWPDGTVARVFNAAGLGSGVLDVSVALAEDQSGHVAGLLGNADVPAAKEFPGSNGHLYPQSVFTGSSRHDLKVRYDGFGNGWRITQKQSLFRYPSGKSTRSYTIRGFPQTYETVASLSPAKRAKAEKACKAAGITSGKLLNACIIDVAATGDAGFAAGDANLQRAVANAPGWSKLSGSSEPSLLAPTLGEAGGDVLAAYDEDKNTGVGVASFPDAPGAPSKIVRTTPISGWSDLSSPLLVPTATGSSQLLISGTHSSIAGDSLNGLDTLQAQADGSFAAPVAIAPTVLEAGAAAADTAVLAGDKHTLIWSATPFLSVWNDSVYPPVAQSVAFPDGAVLEGSIATKLAYDTSGRLWLAWYALALGNSAGLYMEQLDPVTGAAAPGATAQLVPDSSNVSAFDNLTIACNSICHIIFPPDGSKTEVVSWSPGQATPVTVFEVAPHAFAGLIGAAAAPDGRIWIVYVYADSATEQIDARLGDDNGAGGTTTSLSAPPGETLAYDGAVLDTTRGLALAVNFARSAKDTSTTLWGTVLSQP